MTVIEGVDIAKLEERVKALEAQVRELNRKHDAASWTRGVPMPQHKPPEGAILCEENIRRINGIA